MKPEVNNSDGARGLGAALASGLLATGWWMGRRPRPTAPAQGTVGVSAGASSESSAPANPAVENPDGTNGASTHRTLLRQESAPPHVMVNSIVLVRGLLASALVVVIVLGWLLYRGRELPFLEMRLQHSDSTGYRPLETQKYLTTSVPRALDDHPAPIPISLPDLPDGTIPAEAEALHNPRAGDGSAMRDGRILYTINCAMCHGRTGHGDGAVGESYVPRPPDFRSLEVRGLSDGAIFYSISNGILSTPIPEARQYIPRDWHAFREELSDRDRWALVGFVRILGAANATSR